MTKQGNEFNLIQGTFTTEEAREILATLLNDKIKFHSHKDFSHQERYGKPDPHAEVRIPELKKTKEDVFAFLKEYSVDNKFEIHADIKLHFIK